MATMLSCMTPCSFPSSSGLLSSPALSTPCSLFNLVRHLFSPFATSRPASLTENSREFAAQPLAEFAHLLAEFLTKFCHLTSQISHFTSQVPPGATDATTTRAARATYFQVPSNIQLKLS